MLRDLQVQMASFNPHIPYRVGSIILTQEEAESQSLRDSSEAMQLGGGRGCLIIMHTSFLLTLLHELPVSATSSFLGGHGGVCSMSQHLCDLEQSLFSLPNPISLSVK